MSLSRKQIAYGTVLVLAAGAFVWDRITAGGPDPAAAATASDLLIQPAAPKSAAAVPKPPAAATDASQQSIAVASATLRDRLAAVASANRLESGATANAFALQDGWMPRKTSVPDPITIKPSTPDPDQKLADAFRKHHLDAVVVGSRTSYAIVNHNIVYVGQTYRQFKLLSVTQTTALFAKGEARVELRLPGTDTPSDSDRADVSDHQ